MSFDNIPTTEQEPSADVGLHKRGRGASTISTDISHAGARVLICYVVLVVVRLPSTWTSVVIKQIKGRDSFLSLVDASIV